MNQHELERKVWKLTIEKLEAEAEKATLETARAAVELETAKMVQRWTQACIRKDRNPLAN